MESRTLGSGTCTECGGIFIDGRDCFWTLGALGEWEFRNPDLMELHFFTVASFNLQHPSRYTKRALRGLYELYRLADDNGWPPETIRDYARKRNRKKFKIAAPDGGGRIVPYRWRMTISDIYVPEEENTTPHRVREWVKTVREDILAGDYVELYL